MKPLKKNISVSLDSDIVESIREIAEEDGRNLSQYINLVLRKHLRNYDKTRREK